MARVRNPPPSGNERGPTEAPAKAAANLPAPRPKANGTARRKKPTTTSSLLPAALSAGVAGQVLLIAGLAGCAFTIVALASYDRHDVSLSVAGTSQTLNLVGPAGAYVADLLYQAVGFAAWTVLLVGVGLALRLAGRPVGGWFSALVAAMGFVLLAAALELGLSGFVGTGAPFPAGGVVGLLLADAIAAQLGRIGAALSVGTGLLAAATVLFRINWQPLAERAVSRVQQGAPAAVRGVGALGAGAVRASLRVGGAGLDALRGIRGEEADEDDGVDDQELEDEVVGPARQLAVRDARMPPEEAVSVAPAALARRAPEPAERRAPEVRPAALLPAEPVPELPSVWSARKAPPAPPVAVTTGDPDRDAPTKVGGRTLVEVEWEPTSVGRRGDPGAMPALPAHLRGGTPAPVTRAGSRPEGTSAETPSSVNVEPAPQRAATIQWAEPQVVAPRERDSDGGGEGTRAPVLREPPAVLREPPPARPPVLPSPPAADPAPPAPIVRMLEPEPSPVPVRATPSQVEWADPPSVNEDPAFDDELEEDEVEPLAVTPLPAPLAVRPAPERIVPASGPARVAPTGRRRPSGDGVSVVPGNLRSGGAGDDGRAVRTAATPFQLPPLSLLDDHPPVVGGTDESVLHAMARRLTDTLGEFGVDGRVTSIRPGPVITMFEYEPAAGVKLSRIANLSDNLKMALKAISVRIVAPLPGRGCVGIEIPNERRQTVWARDVFGSPDFKNGERTLPMILGKDTEGRPFITDLAKMPHLLVGGTTGSGKSVGVNAMLVSMLFMRTPEELRMILIDPKMLEFALYEDIPHLLHPVVTEPKFASAVLKWACTEMDERYKIMARWQTRHIDTYNQKVEKELQDWTPEKARSYAPKDWPDGELLPIPKKFPFIVIVIDELADLMMVASSDVEASIARIVAKARAAGIHLIVATQTPRRDVITGLIKANMPASLAYQVRSGLDSRVILDQNGAETLLGKGDLLFLRPGTSDLVRIHAPFLSEDEVHRVGDFLRAQGAPKYDLRISSTEEGEDGDQPPAEYDEKYDEAVEMAIQKGKISTSMLQRHLGIGYNRAANIVETMEREGVVGPADGARPREVLVGQL
ncbi:MAG: DNA translocase FtsK 4TM domain-containing protein [Pseudomonadota bacterium]|nr:DNA translocase FtsK 4TM domain-containing protein [Pseudomonadota bacterium]